MPSTPSGRTVAASTTAATDPTAASANAASLQQILAQGISGNISGLGGFPAGTVAYPNTLQGSTQAGVGAYGTVPAAANPQATQAAAIGGNTAIEQQLASLTNSLDQATATGALGQYEATIPGWDQMSAQSSANIGSELAGQIAPDTMAMLNQQAAERGVSFDPTSANTNAAALRAMGLTSQQLQEQGQTDLTSAVSRAPKGVQFDPSTMLVTPSQQQTAQQNANTLAAAPDPSQAAAANLAALNSGMGAGQGAGLGTAAGGAGTTGGVGAGLFNNGAVGAAGGGNLDATATQGGQQYKTPIGPGLNPGDISITPAGGATETIPWDPSTAAGATSTQNLESLLQSLGIGQQDLTGIQASTAPGATADQSALALLQQMGVNPADLGLGGTSSTNTTGAANPSVTAPPDGYASWDAYDAAMVAQGLPITQFQGGGYAAPGSSMATMEGGPGAVGNYTIDSSGSIVPAGPTAQYGGSTGGGITYDPATGIAYNPDTGEVVDQSQYAPAYTDTSGDYFDEYAYDEGE
jgi:hypothetical protein